MYKNIYRLVTMLYVEPYTFFKFWGQKGQEFEVRDIRSRFYHLTAVGLWARYLNTQFPYKKTKYNSKGYKNEILYFIYKVSTLMAYNRH